MFMRLSRARRWKAGWLLAFVYLLCVLAPTLSFALPGSHADAPCLIDDNRVPGVMHARNEMPTQHLHKEGHAHDHSGGHSHANSDVDQRSMSTALDAESIPEKAPYSSDAQCCGLMCVTALPSTVVEIAKPSVPTALCELRGDRRVSDNAPPRHYRPPIS